MIVVNTDGACEPRNPGGHGVGGWVARIDGESGFLTKGFYDCGEYPEMTNNIAEYAAVYGALLDLLHLGSVDEKVLLYTDSKLVVEQVNDRWKCNSPHLRQWRDKIWALMGHFNHNVTLFWVPREQNTEADAQSRVLYSQ